VPAAYYGPASAVLALELLLLHVVQMQQIAAPVSGLEQLSITANSARPFGTNIDFLGDALRSLVGTWAAAPDTTAPSGSWMVPMNQKLARLVFYLLEPKSDDGVVTWNYLDSVLASVDMKTYPILRKR
jgi:hypothetical protein